ncbi:MAG: amino acid aminotransferase, partial [Pseudomonadota bacterium]
MFEQLKPLAADPILGLASAYQLDQNSQKVDLGAGVYKDERGNTPIMAAVAQAQRQWLEQETTKAYSAPAGPEGFNQGMLALLLGEGHDALKTHRATSVQTPGGCGALRIAAGMLNRCREHPRIWVSTPTWANHIPLLGSAGLELVEYPYYDSTLHGIHFDAMMSALAQVAAGDLVLLHGCCHNPSGADLTPDQWQSLAAVFNHRGARPFIDIAYQGLGEGLQADAWGLRYLADSCPELVVAVSCSKNFGLYRERVGAAMVIAETPVLADTCRGQLLNVAREIYSMPPSYGGALVDIVLNNDELAQQWRSELMDVRQRIVNLRTAFVEQLNGAGAGGQFDYIRAEKGMFSFLGIAPEQVKR